MNEVHEKPNMGKMALLTAANCVSSSVRGTAMLGYARGTTGFQYVAVLLTAVELDAKTMFTTGSRPAAGGVCRNEWHTLVDEDTERGLSFAALRYVTSRLPELCAEVAAEVKKRQEKRAGPDPVE